MEAAITFAEVCRLRSISPRTGARERASGVWPPPSYFVGLGTKKPQPRWRAAEIRAWLERGEPVTRKAGR
jgi:hypothetical protein